MTQKQKKIVKILLAIGLFGSILYRTVTAILFVIESEPQKIGLNKESAARFIQNIEAYGKIYQIDVCQGCAKKINGISVRMNPEKNEDEQGRYYLDVLEDHGIDSLIFEQFRTYLNESGLRSYYKTDNYSIFISDGFLNNSWGYLYNHTSKPIAPDIFTNESGTVYMVEHLGDNWYRIAGSLL